MLALNNGWTGGQYSLFRVFLGAYLAFHFLNLLPWSAELFSNQGMLPDAHLSPLFRAFPNALNFCDSPAAVYSLCILAIVSSFFLMTGAYDRVAAVVLWYIWACLLDRNPLIRNPAIPYIGWLLLAHACLPRAPYGSFAARGRTDPRGVWHMPKQLFAAAWIVLALSYTYSGVMKLPSPSWVDGSAFYEVLKNPLARPGVLREFLLTLPPFFLQAATYGVLFLEIAFAPLALFRPLRPYLWLAMVLAHLGLLCLVAFADLTFGMLLVHAFTFDPAWVRASAGVRILHYDGNCVLCHGSVRFVLAEGPADITFAPLPPDRLSSLAVTLKDGSELTQSSAVIALLKSCGGYWRILGTLFSLVPTTLRDATYQMIARSRYKLFGKTNDVCPLMPPELRKRFQTH